MQETHQSLSFKEQLQAMWSAENMLTQLLPELAAKASILGLQKTLALHAAETDQHKIAIEAICKQLDFSHEGKENEELKTMLNKGMNEIDAATGMGIDAAIIESCIQVEHFEIKAYTKLGDMAEAEGLPGVAARLRQTMEEERQSDAKLNFLKKAFITNTAEIGAEGLFLK